MIPFDGGRGSGATPRPTGWCSGSSTTASRSRRRPKSSSWNGQTFPAGSYVVWMDQALRGLAYTTLSAGQDISDRITQLYAPPGAWSHGLLWGADVFEIPDDPDVRPGHDPDHRRRTRSRAAWRSGRCRLVRDHAAGGRRGPGDPRPAARRRGRRGGRGALHQRVRRGDAGRLAAVRPGRRGRARGCRSCFRRGLRDRPRRRRAGRDDPAGRGAQGGDARGRKRQERHALVPRADLRRRRRDRHDGLDS